MNRAGLGALVMAGLVGCGGSNFVGGDDGGDDIEVPPDAGVDAGPDATPPDAVVPMVDREIDGRITINEVMAQNVYTVRDEQGNPGDWVELYNPTEHDLPLWGYGLTDDLAVPGKFAFHQGLVIRARGYVLLWLDNTDVGLTHVGFKLAKDGGAVGLSRPDGSWIDRVEYTAQETDFSAAREPDGSDKWTIEWHPSPGAANPDDGGGAMTLEDDAAPPEPIPAAGDLTSQVYAYDAVPEYHLVVSQAASDALLADPDTYQPAQIILNGRSYGPIGVRLKGQNSFQPWNMKPSLRLSIDEYAPDARLFGLKDMTLNNMDNDLSMMHERLAYYVMRQAGVPASRANHARLYVNGQFYGLYTSLETVKKKMLAQWFTDVEGPLFEATDVDFVAADVPRYELENGPDDRSLLTGLAAALTNPSADAAIADAGQYIDLPAFWSFWAAEAVIGQFDAMPYSNPGDDYFLYADPTTHRLRPIPWGMDETFYASDYDPKTVSSVLARRCSESPSCFAGFTARVWEIVDWMETTNLDGERARVAAQIAPYVAIDQRKPYTTEQVTAYQLAMHWFIKERRDTLATFLPAQ